MRVTKQMLGNQTRKSILYLDQNFLSTLHRGGTNNWANAPMAKITELLDHQLLAIPYSSTHIDEADLNGEYRDELVRFIQRISRGHLFESYKRVEQTQILKAFHTYLDNGSAVYRKDESDALCSSVHDWDEEYSVSVFTSARGVKHRRLNKEQAFNELLKVLPQWANKDRTFEDDVELEIRAAARLLVDGYSKRTNMLMRHLVGAKKADPSAIDAFCGSRHFAEVPAVQLSARLFSAYRQGLRSSKAPLDPQSKRTHEKLRGFFYDVQHAATYAPYCDGYFTDKFMARLMQDRAVRLELDFGCKVFSADKMDTDAFFAWLEGLKSRMTSDHANDLSWAYPKKFPFKKK